MTKNKRMSYPFEGKGTQKTNLRSIEKNPKDVFTDEELEAEIERRINEALKSAKMNWDKENEVKMQTEREEAAKMASMSAEERARAEMEKKQKAFDEERKQYISEKMEFEAAKELAKNKLPLSFAKLLSGADIDSTMSNIDVFKQEFMKAVEEALDERLRGTALKTGSAAVKNYDPFLSGFGC